VLVVVFVVVGLVFVYLGWGFFVVYQERQQMGRIAQAIRAADAWKSAIEAQYRDKKSLPRDASALPGGTPKATSPYGKVSLDAEGILTITLTPEVGSEAGKTIVLAAQPSANGLQWRCGSAVINPKLLPGNCRSEPRR